MKQFTSTGHAQRFLSAFSGISPHFRHRRTRVAHRDGRPIRGLAGSHRDRGCLLKREQPQRCSIATRSKPMAPLFLSINVTVPPTPTHPLTPVTVVILDSKT